MASSWMWYFLADSTDLVAFKRNTVFSEFLQGVHDESIIPSDGFAQYLWKSVGEAPWRYGDPHRPRR